MRAWNPLRRRIVKDHFDKNLNVRELVAQYQPSYILELGAGMGHNTRQLLTLNRPVEVISDTECKIKSEEDGWLWLWWKCGVSYVKLKMFNYAPFSIVDTDHNYWTLAKELTLLADLAPPGGIVCIHDTVSFANTNGIMQNGGTYGDGTPYPYDEIQAETRPYGQAVNDAIDSGAWIKIRESKEANGAVALERTKTIHGEGAVI